MIENLTPPEAWTLLQNNPAAILIDVRSSVEFGFVGHPLGAISIPWKDAPDWQLNPRFIPEIKTRITDTETPILLLCRSGQRSLDAAKVLEAEGYRHLVNIIEGFEGALDENKHRGNINGWRFHGLPWEQS